MADLIDRISGEDDTRPKINLHRFMGAERLYAFGEWTRAEIAAEFDLQGDEATQGSALADNIDAVPQADAKALYILRVESVCMCLEDSDDRLYHYQDGAVDKAKVLEDIQIS